MFTSNRRMDLEQRSCRARHRARRRASPGCRARHRERPEEQRRETQPVGQRRERQPVVRPVVRQHRQLECRRRSGWSTVVSARTVRWCRRTGCHHSCCGYPPGCCRRRHTAVHWHRRRQRRPVVQRLGRPRPAWPRRRQRGRQ